MFTDLQKEKYPSSDIKISAGIYFIHSADEDITIAIDNANLARRSVKGSSDVPSGIYTDRMRLKRSHDQTIASEIWNAINTGAIELFLQPKFDMETRKIIGAEALSRWRNPDGSYKMPYEFIDVLENTAAFGVLSNFIGMTTDSRSFLSFVRHDYFRRILCDWIAKKADEGVFPNDFEILKNLVYQLCYENAKKATGGK